MYARVLRGDIFAILEVQYHFVEERVHIDQYKFSNPFIIYQGVSLTFHMKTGQFSCSEMETIAP